jgi:hypothetical protein
MSEMVCMFCRKGPTGPDSVSLFRVNAKGQPGVWVCQRHIKQTDAPRDEFTETLVAILEGKKP